MRKFFTIFSLLFLTGCGEQSYFSKENVTEEQIAQDMFDCDVKISSLDTSAFSPQKLEQLCMKAKGYKIHVGEPPENYKNITED